MLIVEEKVEIERSPPGSILLRPVVLYITHKFLMSQNNYALRYFEVDDDEDYAGFNDKSVKRVSMQNKKVVKIRRQPLNRLVNDDDKPVLTNFCGTRVYEPCIKWKQELYDNIFNNQPVYHNYLKYLWSVLFIFGMWIFISLYLIGSEI